MDGEGVGMGPGERVLSGDKAGFGILSRTSVSANGQRALSMNEHHAHARHGQTPSSEDFLADLQ